MRTIGALCGAILLWLVAVPVAQARRPSAYIPQGTLDYVWMGVPARGCAAGGVCGVVGSLQVEVNGDGIYGASPGSPIELDDPNAVARVTYPSNEGGESRVCVEPEPYDVMFALRPQHGVPKEGAPEESEVGGLPSAGDCAGPTVTQLGQLRLPVHVLGRRGYSLVGSDSFGAGPFEVTVTSTMRALFASEGSGGSTGVSGPKPKPVLEAYAEVHYRMTDFRGDFAIPFAAAEAPDCEPLGACGASGELSVSLRAPDQTYTFVGAQIVKHRISASSALAALRAGKLYEIGSLYGESTIKGAVTGTFVAPGTASCTDTISGALDLFDSNFAGRSDQLTFDTGSGQDGFFGLQDPLRTDCPGPSSGEILRSGASLANGAIPLADLGSKTLRVRLNGGGSFASDSYAGTYRGSITFTLSRTGERGGTVRTRGYFGEYP